MSRVDGAPLKTAKAHSFERNENNDRFTDVPDNSVHLPDVGQGNQPALQEGQRLGGRIERKSGGRTTNSIGAEVNRVRILLRNKTQHMLSIPDDAIATALHMAKNG